MKITWKGAGSVLLETEQTALLIDPFVSLAGASNPTTLEDFIGVSDILLTGSDMEQLLFVPELIEESDATVHAGEEACAVLEDFLDDTGNLVLTAPGDAWQLGDMKIRVLDGGLKESPVPSGMSERLSMLRRHPVLAAKNRLFLHWARKEYPRGGQAMSYEIQAEGKTILILGSMEILEDVAYPSHIDLLILPYCGAEAVDMAMDVLTLLRPDKVLLTSFDSPFPPASSETDTRPFCRRLQESGEKIRVARPRAGKAVHV